MHIPASVVAKLARECGFELSGAAPAGPLPEAAFYEQWVAAGFAGEMRYLTDHRAALRRDPRSLLEQARSVICVGKLYNGPQPYSTQWNDAELGWISRYAWGSDYHTILKGGLGQLVQRLEEVTGSRFAHKICVDTAPLLERALARRAGLGWIGKNSCLIHQGAGSWFFLGELLVDLEVESGSPPPDRCGTCTRCIDACPTAAIVPVDGPSYTVDSRLCIAYLNIELRSAVPEHLRPAMGWNVFGCDICQDVCPWNRKAPVTGDPDFKPAEVAPRLEKLAALSEDEFRALFRPTPVSRARYSGFLRNVAIAMGNAARPEFRAPLERMAASPDPLVSEHAGWALARLTPVN